MSGMDKARSAYNLRVNLLVGANAATNIAVAGIATDDEIIFCGHLTTAASIATLADLTSTMSISAAGQVQSSTATNNDQLWLFWIDTSA